MVGLVLRCIEFTTSDMISLYFVARMYPVLISQLGSCPAVHLPSRSWGLQTMLRFLQDHLTISGISAVQIVQKICSEALSAHLSQGLIRDFITWIPYFKEWNNMMTFASLKRKKTQRWWNPIRVESNTWEYPINQWVNSIELRELGGSSHRRSG